MASFIGSMIFGTIGFIAFVYGKKMQQYKTFGIGIALIAFPYFVSNTLCMYLIGTALTVSLFFFKD